MSETERFLMHRTESDNSTILSDATEDNIPENIIERSEKLITTSSTSQPANSDNIVENASNPESETFSQQSKTTIRSEILKPPEDTKGIPIDQKPPQPPKPDPKLERRSALTLGSGADTSSLFHGKLEIYLSRAKHLMNKDGVGQVLPTFLSAKIRCGVLGVSDPMVKVYLDQRFSCTSSCRRNTLNPQWKEMISINVCGNIDRINLRIVDVDPIGEQLLGQLSFKTSTLKSESVLHGYFPLSYADDIETQFQEHFDDDVDVGGANGNGSEHQIFDEAKPDTASSSKYGYLKTIIRFTTADEATESFEDHYNAAIKHEVTNMETFTNLLDNHPNIVRDTYFKARLGGDFVFYDSAEVDVESVPKILLDDGSYFEPRRCWVDVYDSLLASKKFICIAGWSVNPDILLVRGDETRKMTLGELLLQRAENGVLIYIMIWDDLSSNAFRSVGLLNTYDEVTFKYFRHTKVHCVKVSRGSITSEGLFYSHHQKTIITDYSLGGTPQRLSGRGNGAQDHEYVCGVKAFIGGIDLTKGRYDSGEKSLFRTLENEHADDYYNRCIPPDIYIPLLGIKRKLGPRQPWQDAHCQVFGSTASDILQNFIERWRQQVRLTGRRQYHVVRLAKVIADTPAIGALPPGYMGFKGLRKRLFQNEKEESQAMFEMIQMAEATMPQTPTHNHRHRSYSDIRKRLGSSFRKGQHINYGQHALIDSTDSLGKSNCTLDPLKFDFQKIIKGDPDLKDFRDLWISQIVRSSSADTTHFQTRERKNTSFLVKRDKNSFVDSSYEKAYVHYIRSAKHFIYIESQYFLGSCHLWKRSTRCGCVNPIPGEILMKIKSKIRANEEFHVYVVIPLFPEGLPGGAPCQQILRFQFCTIEMMYNQIALCLQECGIQASPRDYFSLYFLGQRESRAALEPEMSGDDFAEEAIPNISRCVTDDGIDDDDADSSDYKTIYLRMRKNRRFQVYVHSKLLIVDDEKLVIGSANINQRSFDGNRDTEIGICAFQPFRRADETSTPQGKIFGFRMQLWAQHLGPKNFDIETVKHPSSYGCIRLMTKNADANWEVYSAPGEPRDPDGHLMRYPYNISLEGEVTPAVDSIPDYGAPLLGRKTKLPNKLTT